jgi:hypothetical protein
MDSTTQSLESLLDILHSRNAPVAHCPPADQTALIQKLESIERACASLHLLHDKVDSLCEGMQQIRAELESEALAPEADALHALAVTPDAQAVSATCSPEIQDSTHVLDITTAPDFVTVNVREETPDDQLASPTQSTDVSVTHASFVEEQLTPSLDQSAVVSNVSVQMPKEPAPDYANTSDLRDIDDHDELYVIRIRQEAELVHEVD